MDISINTVQQLIQQQFPQWASLPIRPVAQSGHDNRTFHLGDEMTVRLPSGADYVAQVEKEFQFLPFLAPHLTLPISSPIAKGMPADCYAYPFLINRFLSGEAVTKSNVTALPKLAKDLAAFLKELQAIDPTTGPMAGKHNFFRGGDLAVYHEETMAALASLKELLPVDRLEEIWTTACATTWQHPPVWIHGDVAPGNLLVQHGTLCGVIDFGIMGVGDPACDYAMAWTFFDANSRPHLLEGLEEGTVCRARGWALWKALITYHTIPEAKDTIQAILQDT